jgi:hypothetical protein
MADFLGLERQSLSLILHPDDLTKPVDAAAHR